MSHELADDSAVPTLTQLCLHGDLTLNVGKDDGTIECRYRVLKVAMCLASPVWRAMLTGPSTESGKDEIPFVDDDPEALLLVLRVAHLRTYEIPHLPAWHEVVNVATICDKYDTVAISRPFVKDWMAHHSAIILS